MAPSTKTLYRSSVGGGGGGGSSSARSPGPLPTPPRPTGTPSTTNVNNDGNTSNNTNKSRTGRAGVGLGMGKSKTAVRHRKVLRDTIHSITTNDIKRLARRGGVKRVSKSIYEDVRVVMRKFLTDLLHDMVAILEMRGQKTLTTLDVVFALKRQGRTIYGFGDTLPQ